MITVKPLSCNVGVLIGSLLRASCNSNFNFAALWSVAVEVGKSELFQVSTPDIIIHNKISSKFSEDFHELKILQDGQKVFSIWINYCKSYLTMSDIVERTGRLAGVHMALSSKPCCISEVCVLGLETLQYSTNSTTFGVL